MAKLAVKKASTDVTVYLFIRDSSVTTGAGKTGLAYNTSSLVAYYVRPLASAAALTLATQTVTGAHSDGGFVEVDATNMPGVYRLDLPDAVCATGVNSVVVMLKGAANMAPVVLEIQLTSYDPNDAVRLGMTALPNAAADGAGGLPISDAGGLDLDALNTNVGSILADTGTDGVLLSSGTGAKQISLDAGKVLLQDTQGAITWAQQKIVAAVESEGALHIVNTGNDGIGLYAEGEYGTFASGTEVGAVETGNYGRSTYGTSVGWDIGSDSVAMNLQAMLKSIAISGDSDISTTADLQEAIPSTADVADAVWDEAIAGHTTGTTFGGKNQKVVPSETINDYKADVSGLALEATLTAIKGATWTNETLVKIVADIAAISAGSGASVADILNALLASYTVSGSVGESLGRLDNIQAKTDLITTGTTLSIASAVSGSTITAHRGDTLSAALENIGALTNNSKVWFTVKRDFEDADSAAIVQIEKTGGLLYINGAAGTSGNGSLTINDEASGDVTIVLAAAETAKLGAGSYQYDIQVLRSAGTPVSTLTHGEFIVDADVTKATA